MNLNKFFKLTFSFIFLALFFKVQAQPDISSGLIAHYPLDGDALDNSGNGNHGTINGAIPTTDRDGNINSAYAFDGVDDLISLTPNQSFKPQLPITISAWIYKEEDKGQSIFRNDYQEDFYSGVWLNILRTGQIEIAYGDGGPAGPASRRSKTGSTVLENGRWYHIAGVIRGEADMSIYIDGRDDCGIYGGTGGGLFYTDNLGTIGKTDPNGPALPPFYFHGNIDEVRFYNRALSGEDISALAGLPCWNPEYAACPDELTINLTDNLLAHYPLDGNVLDSTANNNDGTVNGAIPTADRNGNQNSAYEFDGIDDFISLTPNQSFKPQLPITISAWVYKEEDKGQSIFRNDYQEDFYSGVWLNILRTGQVEIAYGDGGPAGPTSRRSKTGSTALENGRWYHITGIIRGETDMTIYIDCEDDCGTYAGSGSGLFYTDNSGTIGKTDANGPGIPPLYFHGKIDHVLFYDRALNSREVAVLGECNNLCTLSDPVALATNPDNCNTFTGSLELSAQNANGPLEYSIDNGESFQPSPIFNTLNAQTYNIVIREQNDSTCFVSTTATLEDPDYILVGEFGLIPPSDCGADDGTIIVNATSTSNNLEYSIDDINFQDSNTFTGLGAGSYSVVVRNADAIQCALAVVATLEDPENCNPEDLCDIITIELNSLSDCDPNTQTYQVCFDLPGIYLPEGDSDPLFKVVISGRVITSENYQVQTNDAGTEMQLCLFNMEADGREKDVFVQVAKECSRYIRKFYTAPICEIPEEDPDDRCDITAIETSQIDCDGDGTYTVQLELRYNDPPATGQIALEIDGAWTFHDITSSPQILTVRGLPANGRYARVFAKFTDVTGCTIYQRNLYRAPFDCRAARLAGNRGEVSIFPNPSNGRFQILVSVDSYHQADVKVFNQLGQLVKDVEITENTNSILDMTDQPNGIYTVRIAGDDYVMNQKIQINK